MTSYPDGTEDVELILSPLVGYEKCPLVSLEEAVEPLISIVPDVMSMVCIAKQNSEELDDGLTTDESASITLYTIEWEPADQCLHRVLNWTLRSEDRLKLKPWFLYFKLILTALWKLPSSRQFIYRGVNIGLNEQYRKGAIITWWGFSSCVLNMAVLTESLDKAGRRTIFTIDCISGKNIARHSFWPSEIEVLLSPGRKFVVMGCSQPASDLDMIQLREVSSMLLPEPFPSTTSKATKLEPSTTTVEAQAKTGTKDKATPKTSSIVKKSKSIETSAFYNACRDNNIDLVKNYLETMPLEDIDQLEPNGSTALHVAAYRGHEKVVALLLEKGACLTTKNKYNLTPLDEAKTDSIKTIIRRRRHQDRFVSESVEWILSTNDADYQAHEYSKKLETYGQDPKFDQLIVYIKENYLQKDLRDIDNVDDKRKFFDKAIKKRDSVYLLQAYTADTGFYSALNLHLAQMQLENLTGQDNLGRAYYIGLIAFHPKFQTWSYTGTTYRGMIITKNDLKQYKIGTRILTKTFSSTSKRLEVALGFLKENRAAADRLSTVCIYTIRNERTALDIAHVSMFPDEQEVLILPYSAVKIIDMKQNEGTSPNVEIKLKECEPW